MCYLTYARVGEAKNGFIDSTTVQYRHSKKSF
jgi:hypothetical protein